MSKSRTYESVGAPCAEYTKGSWASPTISQRGAGQLRSRVGLPHLGYIDALLHVTCSIMLLRPTSLFYRPVRHQLTSTQTTFFHRQPYSSKSLRRMAPFERLIRFEGDDGRIHYGDFGASELPRDVSGKTVQLVSGNIATGFTKSDKQATIKKLLPPLLSTPIFLCVGLNYKQHAEEGNLPIPTYPTIFAKPPTALSGPGAQVQVHKDCQSQLDYEGELTIVIGKTGKNIAAADYADYVLGYTVGNDVSARNFQIPASVSGGQFGYAKSFDGFAPIGPCIASAGAIGGDPNKIRFWTKVNGEKRQETSTDDMIWTVGSIVEHLSRGTTLQAGTCIMTGTPSGVGVFMVSLTAPHSQMVFLLTFFFCQNPKGFVGDGDEVEVYVEGIGSLVNTFKFE